MQSTQIPWDWYIVRASALVGFLLLYVSIFVGTVSGLPGIKKYFLRLGSLKFHCWISLQALIFALIHGLSLLFHKFIPFSLADIFVPFHSDYEPLLVALGTISLYLMIILVATSYARKYISQKIWRLIHFLNIFLYIFSIVHSLYLGTDLKSGLLREVFIWGNGLLILLLLLNMIHRIWERMKNKPIICETQSNNENLRQGDSSGGEERSSQNFRRRI
jgi:methionine sulfoxide reductase heme-binding subunit